MLRSCPRRCWLLAGIALLGLLILAVVWPSVASGGRAAAASPDSTSMPRPAFIPGSDKGGAVPSSPWISATEWIRLPTAYSGPNLPIVYAIDTKTGAERPLDSVNAILLQQTGGTGAPGPYVAYNPWATHLSPDGRWLLFPSGSHAEPTWVAVTARGAEMRREWARHILDDGGLGGAAWMRDGVHWVEVSERRGPSGPQCFACVYGLDKTGFQESPLRLEGEDHTTLPPFPNSQFLFTTDGRAYIVSALSGSDPGDPAVHLWLADCRELLPGADSWTLRRRLVPFRATRSAMGCNDVWLSPSGLWLTWRDSTHGLHTRVMVGRPDGSDATAVLDTTGAVSYPRWTPDERAIVVHWSGDSPQQGGHGDGLYTIAVDRVLARLRRSSYRPAAASGELGSFPVVAGGSR